MPNIVYCVSRTEVTRAEDLTVWGACYSLGRDFNAGDERYCGCGNLGDLAPGGLLFVVGHGNAGSKIGAHGHEADALGARSLVQQLVADGLPRSPRAEVTIHLYACATGSSVRTMYSLWRKEPYALRFARALAAANFNDYYVVGYAGFMNPTGTYSLSYHVQDADRRNWQGGRGDAPTILYRVNARGFTQVAGDEWKQYTDITFHRGRANSTVLSIRRAT